MAEFNLRNTGVEKLKPTKVSLTGSTTRLAKKKFNDIKNNPDGGLDALIRTRVKQTAPSNFPIRESYLGTPVYASLEFPSGQYRNSIDPASASIPYDGIALDTVIMKVTQTRNIVENKVNGLNGTVKEFINNGDYLIEATGKIIGNSIAPDTDSDFGATTFTVGSEGDRFPYYEVEKLKIISEIPNNVDITSDYLELFGVRQVVIKTLEVRQVEGAANYYDFKMIMVSDNPDFILEA